MRPPRAGQALAGVAVLVVVAVVATGVATSSSRAAATAPSTSAITVPVTDSVLVCPTLGGPDPGTGSVLSASSPATSGTIEVRSLTAPASAAPLARLAASASVLRYAPRPGAKPGAVLVHATGARAAGLTAQVTTRVPSGVRRSLRSASCSEPTGDTWLAGGSTVSGRRDIVYLTNIEQSPATVDVSVYGASGPVQAPNGQGVTVPGRQQVILALDALAPGLASTVVHVHARSGRVAAALQDVAASGLTAAGVDWVPPSVEPSRSLTLTGIPGQATGRHTLLLLAPGSNDANVRIRFATADGLLSPPLTSDSNDNSLDVPSGQVVAVNLDKTGVAPPYAVLVDSDQPVVAGLQTSQGGRKTLVDFSWAAASPRVLGSAVSVPWVYRSTSVTSYVQITATGDKDVVVRLTTFSSTGQALTAQSYPVAAGRTLQLAPGSATLAAGSALVEIPPGASVVVGTSSIEFGAHGPLITGGPLLQTPLTEQHPSAVADPAVGLPGH